MDLGVLEDDQYVPPSPNDIANWSAACIGIMELTETMGKNIDNTLDEMKSERERIRRRRDFLFNKFQEVDEEDDKRLAELPDDVAEYEKLQAKREAMKAAEQRQRELLGLNDEADDDMLVEESTRKLQQYLRGEIDEAPTSIDKLPPLEAAIAEDTIEQKIGSASTPKESEGASKVGGGMAEDSLAEMGDMTVKPKRGEGKKAKEYSGVPGKKKRRKKSGGGKKAKARAKPAIQPEPPAADRLLAILSAEEERDVFRARTLQALERNNPERVEEMKKVFRKERKQADRLMKKILSDFKPTVTLKSTQKRPKGKSPKRRDQPVRQGTFGSLNKSKTLSPKSGICDAAVSGGKYRKFTAKNMLPGSFAPPSPPNMPDDMNKKLIDLHGEQARSDPVDGAPIDRGVKDLVNDHSDPVDLNFPDLEMYKRSYHDREKWNEPQKY